MMKIALDDKLKKDLPQLMHKHPGIIAAYVFGSVAIGFERRRSDIDIAIFSKDATDENRLEIMTQCWLKTFGYKLDIQPLVYPLADYYSDNDFIQQEIIARGIEIPLGEQKISN